MLDASEIVTVGARGQPKRGVLAEQLVVPLDGADHAAPLVGGKGAWLDRLVAAGFPVPSAAVLTVAAYRQFVAEARLAPLLDRVAREPARVGSGPDEEAVVQAAFLGGSLPVEVREAIHEAWTAAGGDSPVAVRSSATAEDLATASSAGQYVSVLGVEGAAGVERAVRRVWASLWRPGARAYRRHMGVGDGGLAMAVVVQRMVPAERSGVCLTADPTARGMVRLEAVEGLGEALVSGRVTPEVFQLRRSDLRGLDSSAPPAELREVARLALRVEEELGGQPQDVEWSVAGGRVWVLQARPITAGPDHRDGDGFDTPARPGEAYAPAGVSEMLPGVVPPLTWTVNAPMVEEAFRQLFDRLGVLPPGLEGPYAVLGRFRGQAALNISLVKQAARHMAGGSGAEVERQYLGEVLTEAEDEPRAGLAQRLGRLGPTLRALRLRRWAEFEGEVFERAVEEVVGARADIERLRTTEILAYRARVRDLAAGGVTAEVAVAAAAVASYRALEVALDRWLGADGAAWAQRLTRDAAGGAQGACGCALKVCEVFCMAGASAELADAVRWATPADVEDRLRALGPAGDALVTTFAAGLEVMGSAAVYGGPAWSEQRDYVWSVVLRCFATATRAGRDLPGEARAAVAADLADLERRLTRTWRWRTTRLLTGQLVDVRRRTLRRLVADARALLRRRETVKAALLHLGGEERRATVVLAERLGRWGALPRTEDVELLADWELEALAGGGEALPAGELDRRRRLLEELRTEASLPALLLEGFISETPPEGALQGWGASPGRHRGRVRVARDLAEAAGLQPGEVLVAPATDPSWTPLFVIAGSVVVERGGPLSHAAIVSRELGVPAVLNAAGATSRLRTGDLVEVDGTTGVVAAVDEEAA